jgi:hypothetical protein
MINYEDTPYRGIDIFDSLFDVYDRHLKFLSSFDDLRDVSARLSREFITGHDAMLAAMVDNVPFSGELMYSMMNTTEEIVQLVLHRRRMVE